MVVNHSGTRTMDTWIGWPQWQLRGYTRARLHGYLSQQQSSYCWIWLVHSRQSDCPRPLGSFGDPVSLKCMPLSLLGSWLKALLHLLKLWPKDSNPSLEGTYLQPIFRTHQKTLFETQLCVTVIDSNFMNPNLLYRYLFQRRSVSQITWMQSYFGTATSSFLWSAILDGSSGHTVSLVIAFIGNRKISSTQYYQEDFPVKPKNVIIPWYGKPA